MIILIGMYDTMATAKRQTAIFSERFVDARAFASAFADLKNKVHVSYIHLNKLTTCTCTMDFEYFGMLTLCLTV